MLNQVLLVIRNYQGQCEMNFISTVDEFMKEYVDQDGLDASDRLRQTIEGGKPFDWAGTYYASGDDSYDLRLCQGPKDLLKFFRGDYNNSIANMEDRNPGSVGFYRGWSWENHEELCSVLAVQAVMSYIREPGVSNKTFAYLLQKVMPDFPVDLEQNEKSLSLDAVISNASLFKKQERTGHNSRSQLEL